MTNIKQLRQKLDRKQGEQDRIQSDLEKEQDKHHKANRDLKRVRKAQEIVRTVALRTQQQLEYHISSVVSNAEAAVFDDPYELKMEFEQRRGKTECDLWFERDGQKRNPTYSGVGAVDVAALALRVASWSLSRKRRNVLILDEPMKHLKGEVENRRAIEMMHSVSQELGLQIITVSDERAPREDIVAGADKVFEVTKKGGESKVKEL